MNEPMTVVTDGLLSALALVLALRLARSALPLPRARWWWAASFIAVSVAALTGGTWHGIPPETLPGLRHHLWSITYVTIVLADFLILAGAARAVLPRGPRGIALGLLTGRFLAGAALILMQRDFRYVGYDYLGTLLLLLAFGLALGRRDARTAGLVLGGVFVSLGGALVQARHLGLHAHFNHNDLFHLIQMAGLWLFYRGGLRLADREDRCLLDQGPQVPEPGLRMASAVE